ncbi:glycerol-3-phosphate responsive antiterminator [Embleya sp. NPDC050493]|uniref:glycerol-3-phosphate responsive antiterminator n=1 Tax=Embleya sp. NPDC050493 TaxID=3363989 RepID=UPI003792D2FB
MNASHRPASAPRMSSVLSSAFVDVPVIASIIGPQRLQNFLGAPAKVCILASIPVGQLPNIVQLLGKAGKTVFVNVDSCPGLAQDKGALEFLKAMGAHGMVSTRLSLMEKGRPLGLLTMQKVFVTDRSNMRRSTDAIARGGPDLVEIMPSPIVARMTPEAKRAMSPFVAAGFVETAEDAAAALALGAVAVATSDPRLWDLRRDRLVALGSSPSSSSASSASSASRRNTS